MLAKGEAKGKIVPVRLDPDDYKIVMAAAKAGDQTLSAWIRHTLRTAAEQQMFDGTLHKAMKIILLERESYTATTQELSVEIERRGLYMRKDGNAARAKQINARVRKYPELFEFVGLGVVRLTNTLLNNSKASD
jgi:uncharacterized protein (DUF1778 family)